MIEESNYDRDLPGNSYQFHIIDYYTRINSSTNEGDIRDFNYAYYRAAQYAEKNPLNMIDGIK